MGANFILYGPIDNAAQMYLACAIADAFVAYSMIQEFGNKPKSKNHPLFKIFDKRFDLKNLYNYSLLSN